VSNVTNKYINPQTYANSKLLTLGLDCSVTNRNGLRWQNKNFLAL